MISRILTPQETHPHIRTVLGFLLTMLLSAVAGMTDAIGFVQAGEFASFMSGNSTRMAIATSAGDWKRAERLLTVIVLFVLGNAIGAIVSRLGGKYHGTVVLTYVGLLLALAAGLPAIPGVPDLLGLEDLPGMKRVGAMDMTLASLVMMILAMGAINSAVETVEGVGLGLTYVTGALSKFGRGLGHYLMGKPGLGWGLQAAPWTGIVIGAMAGAELDVMFGRHALWLPCGVTFLLALGPLFLPRQWQRTFV